MIDELERAIETIEHYIASVEFRMQGGEAGVVIGWDMLVDRKKDLNTALTALRAALDREANEALTGRLQIIYCTPYSCEYCGDHIAVGWAFCPECGTSTGQGAAELEREKNPLTCEGCKDYERRFSMARPCVSCIRSVDKDCYEPKGEK